MADRDELDKLEDLYQQGMLTDAEREQARERVRERDDSGGGGRRRRLNGLAIGLIVIFVVGLTLVVVALASGGGGKSTTTKPAYSVSGVVVVTMKTEAILPDASVALGTAFGTGGYTIGMGCHTLAGYQDIVTGAPVVISDGSGAPLTTVKLEAGVFDENADCVFAFKAVVAKVDSYQVKVGQRSPVAFSSAGISNPQLIL